MTGATWPRDDEKLGRVRRLLAANGLDALVVRAPDNVLYLTNFWGMKGYDLVVFPRDGEPTLVTLEASEADAAETAWTDDVRLFRGYDERDARPPTMRALDTTLATLRERGLTGRIGLELSLGTQAADRMIGEPTTYTAGYFSAFDDVVREVVDATPLLGEARALKTAQEIERIRLANEIAAEAMQHVWERLRPGMSEAEAAAIWEGHVHTIGTGYRGRVGLARGFSLVWSGPGIRTFTSTSNRPVQANEPTLFEIWVCADGYWCDHTKNLCPGPLAPRYEQLLDQLLAIYEEGVALATDGSPLAELDRTMRTRIAEAGYPGQPSHPLCHGVGARAHEPPYAHQAGGGTVQTSMVLAIEPGIYWPEGGGLRLEDNFLVTPVGPEKLSPFPDDPRSLHDRS